MNSDQLIDWQAVGGSQREMTRASVLASKEAEGHIAQLYSAVYSVDLEGHALTSVFMSLTWEWATFASALRFRKAWRALMVSVGDNGGMVRISMCRQSPSSRLSSLLLSTSYSPFCSPRLE